MGCVCPGLEHQLKLTSDEKLSVVIIRIGSPTGLIDGHEPGDGIE